MITQELSSEQLTQLRIHEHMMRSARRGADPAEGLFSIGLKTVEHEDASDQAFDEVARGLTATMAEISESGALDSLIRKVKIRYGVADGTSTGFSADYESATIRVEQIISAAGGWIRDAVFSSTGVVLSLDQIGIDRERAALCSVVYQNLDSNDAERWAEILDEGAALEYIVHPNWRGLTPTNQGVGTVRNTPESRLHL